MRDDIKERWVAKLRSGDYLQTKNVLQNEEGYCCLGVLCEIAVEDGIAENDFYDGRRCYNTTKSISGDEETGYSTLPQGLLYWAALTGRDSIHLARMNDQEGKNFHEIADYIELEL
jgi:hypothetical protein